MKKFLLATTAIVTTAFAGAASANDVKLSIGGSITTGVGVGQYNSAGAQVAKDFHIVHNGEIHFTGAGTLDNGLEIVARVELENVSEGDQMDQQWVQLNSQLGTFVIGGDSNAAANTGAVGFTGVGLGQSGHDAGSFFAPGQVGAIGGTDSFGIHYYTPRIMGLEVGVSWQPTGTDANTIRDTDTITDNSVDIMAVGAKYTNSFGGMSIDIGGGWVQRDVTATAAAPIEGMALNQTKTFDGFGVGAAVGMDVTGGKITLRGRYEQEDVIVATTDPTPVRILGFDGDGNPVFVLTDPLPNNDDQAEVTRYGGGLAYATGPWTFSTSVAFEETDVKGGNETDDMAIAVGTTYALGTGVDVGAAVNYGETETEGAAEVDGWGGGLFLGISF
jgi:outer membrane protein OmpU